MVLDGEAVFVVDGRISFEAAQSGVISPVRAASDQAGPTADSVPALTGQADL
ncbi:hypothetical protein [Streptomyces sp. NPDC054794]